MRKRFSLIDRFRVLQVSPLLELFSCSSLQTTFVCLKRESMIRQLTAIHEARCCSVQCLKQTEHRNWLFPRVRSLRFSLCQQRALFDGSAWTAKQTSSCCLCFRSLSRTGINKSRCVPSKSSRASIEWIKYFPFWICVAEANRFLVVVGVS